MNITILGSTGSIGISTLDVIRQAPADFAVYALVAGKNLDVLCSQILEFQPKLVVVADDGTRERLAQRLDELSVPRHGWPELSAGPQGRVDAATAPEVDFVLSAIVGVAGLEATYRAILARKRLGLANKEVLVAGGAVVMDAVRRCGVDLIPVDSEHNGAHQCLRAGQRSEVTRLLLTASGGPFRDLPAQELWTVSPEQALHHPTWKMGPRITIDSATMMNKGFEVIEACWLFDLPADRVEVVVHPQSSVHAMVEYEDGSVLAQISATDMRLPIQYALTFPRRASAPVPRIDWQQARTWTFAPPDLQKFRCLALAYEAQRMGTHATCTLNAADEIAVGAFLDGRIPFPAIAETVEECLGRQSASEPATIEEVIEIDLIARDLARKVIARRHSHESGGAVTAS